MTQIEQQYQHWDGAHEGIWRRRYVIARGALEGCLKLKWLQRLVAGCWLAALGMIILLFFYSQLVDSTSALADWMGAEDAQLKMVIVSLELLIQEKPALAISVPWNLVFGFYALMLFYPTMLVLTVAVPRIIAADLSSNAIVVYASKAVSRWDYLLGKFGAVVGLLFLTWVGPLVFAWLGGNLLAPNWTFFWHTREALTDSLVFGLAGLGFLAVLALGVSSLSANGKVVTFAWLALWLLGWGMEGPAEATQTQWLRHLSFRYNLSQVHTKVFNPRETFTRLDAFRHEDGIESPLVRPMRMFTRMQNRDLREAHRRARGRFWREIDNYERTFNDETEELIEKEGNPNRDEEIRMERAMEWDQKEGEIRGKILREEEEKILTHRQRSFGLALFGLGFLMALSVGVIAQRFRPR
ncbi:MAG: hypothetical protein CMO74_09865 [Verrucomicrobiales bacterium]|nr:hypothetical protein [Verrucomicrobiales bacterium]|tara:strand:+ start:17599 stop:18831 length:1233 start_codon:yes stop_codon:yes gene_type:complete